MMLTMTMLSPFLPLLLLILANSLLISTAWMTMSSSSSIPNQFPASTRQALLQKAADLKQTKGCYSTVGWSNRLGSIITPAAIPGVYTVDRPFYWNKIDVGCRMTVIEIPSENNGKPDLWVHSPVGLDGPLLKVLGELGTIKYVVSPNYEHLKFAKQWADSYPEAEMWACPGLMEREPDTRWTKEVPYDAMKQELWPGIEALHINIEANPFTGKPFFSEVIFYHKTSKTLMTTDLYWNYPAGNGITNSNFESIQGYRDQNDPWELAPAIDGVPIGSRIWKFSMDKIYAPFYNNFMINNQDKYQQVCDAILNEWDVETVIPAHGDLLRGKDMVQAVLGKHLLSSEA
jgi:hypothetical protein